MMVKIDNVKIINHYKDEYGNVHGVYKCDVNGNGRVFVRHGDEVGAICFWLGESVEKCISKVRDDVSKEIIMLVEIEFEQWKD